MYLISTTNTTYTGAWTYCNEIGMKPVSFETVSQYTCFRDQNIASLKKFGDIWTSGTYQNCDKLGHWCSPNLYINNLDYVWTFSVDPNDNGGLVARASATSLTIHDEP
ncbi:hypothetical protein B566_EDAN015255, partial [Ephemera danica]